MKIGVLTLPLHNNFGGILQAYALQKVLKDFGHNVVLIDKSRYVSLGPWYKRYPIYIKRGINRYILGKDIIVKADVEQNRVPKTIAKYTEPFVEKYIKRVYTKDFSNIREQNFDVLIVGSDQVWRPKYFFSRIENAYLEFAKDWDVRRIAYAASFGTEEWEYTEEQTNNCAALLNKFNAVSVRESSAVQICNDNFGIKAEHVLDPTMLLSKGDYIKLFKDYNTAQSDGNLFCYILDEGEEKKSIIDCAAKEKGLKPFYVNSRYEDLEAPLEERIQQPAEKWLRAFYDAEFIITDSFHACVFSIIFNKPFIVYGNRKRGLARFNSLLSIFGLEERIASTKEEATKAISEPIDWEKVNEIHRQWKEKSFSFLNHNLKQQQ
ncbi:MAG: polysaccharide pyruvyl transferase family protein [Bacteroidaceae bacterium]|nr:polysaccharide pyruvyl transferase family protein [Bacteroidaceae bacterium]